jgi:hypothetical protein
LALHGINNRTKIGKKNNFCSIFREQSSHSQI